MADSIAMNHLQSKKCKTIVERDRISDLPDEVLSNIVARLTLKEAIATSTLSKRWTDVWTSYPFLDFGLFKSIYHTEVLVSRVKKIMEKYNGGKLHIFKIIHWMPKRLWSEINEWISFAIRNHVCELDLNLSKRDDGGIGVNHCVPPHLFAREEMMISNPSCPNVMGVSLTDLRLTSVDFSDKVFDMILHNCSSLETFYVKRNHKLINAKNTAPHLKLKSLKMCLCFKLEKLELLAPNLVSFNYTGQQRSLRINDAQQLVSLRLVATSMNTIFPRRKDFIINQFSCYLPMLESLFVSVALFEDMSDFTELCVFSNLKTLALDDSSSIRLSCQVAAFIISAAPYLELLELDLKYPDSFPWETEKLELPSMSTHKNLKEVKVSGFQANAYAVDFLVYLIKRSVSLQKIELTGIYTRPGDSDDCNEHVQHLRNMLNTNIQLIFHDYDISDPGAICVIGWC